MYSKYLELLKKTGQTTAQVCEATGIPQSTMSMWKSRDSGVSIKTLKALADHFKVTVDYFLSEEDSKNE